MPQRIDLTNKRFGRLTVVGVAPYRQGARRRLIWECSCDCGRKAFINGQHLRDGLTRSCGCLSVDTRRLEPGEGGFRKVLRTYRLKAAERGLQFDLTEDDVRQITKLPCHYCGIEPYRVANHGAGKSATTSEYAAYIYNGIDRKDNAGGYTPDNITPCCRTCNFAKRDMLMEDFRDWALRLARHQLTHQYQIAPTPSAL